MFRRSERDSVESLDFPVTNIPLQGEVSAPFESPQTQRYVPTESQQTVVNQRQERDNILHGGGNF